MTYQALVISVLIVTFHTAGEGLLLSVGRGTVRETHHPCSLSLSLLYIPILTHWKIRSNAAVFCFQYQIIFWETIKYFTVIVLN